MELVKDVPVFDLSRLAFKPEKNADGFLTAEVNVTRIGIFDYYDALGKKIRALRLPEEVFKPESMATQAKKPATNQHPPKLLTAEDAKQYTVGHTGENPRREGDFIRNSVTIFDKATIEQIEAGNDEVSCGYYADLDMKSGEHPDFGPYDLIQRNIRHNHLAVALKAGRGGPEVRMLMDSIDIKLPTKESTMKKIKVGDKEYEVSEDLADAIEMDRATTGKTMDALKSSVQKFKDKMKKAGLGDGDDDEDAEAMDALGDITADEDPEKAVAQLDAIETPNPLLKKIKKRMTRLVGKLSGALKTASTHMDALKPENLTKTIETRMRLVAVAHSVMDAPDTKKLLAMPEIDLKKAIILAKNSSIVLEGKSVDFIDGMFETIAVKVGNQELSEALGAILLDDKDKAIKDDKDKPAPCKAWTPVALSASRRAPIAAKA